MAWGGCWSWGDTSSMEGRCPWKSTSLDLLGQQTASWGDTALTVALFPWPLQPSVPSLYCPADRGLVTAARWLPPTCHCWTGAATTSSCCPPAPAGLLKHGAGWIPQSAPAFHLRVAAISPLGTLSLDLPPPLSSQYPFPTADPSPEASSASSAESHRTQISRILTSILSLLVSPIKAAPLHSRAGVS